MPNIILSMIEAIFELQIADLISKRASHTLEFQMQLFRVKSEMISYVQRISNTTLHITQLQNNKEVFTLSFSTPDVEQPQYAKQLRLVIRPLWDGFDIYELLKTSTKLIHEYKVN